MSSQGFGICVIPGLEGSLCLRFSIPDGRVSQREELNMPWGVAASSPGASGCNTIITYTILGVPYYNHSTAGPKALF